jgi:diguanylate cyclase (GGDEF)-like protein
VARLQNAALARHDALTGIANRRAFDERLAELWAACEADDEGLALLLIDVDHFKRYNDLYGHPAGDECLRRVALALRDLLGESDLIARYGGEEFAVLLPRCRLEQAVVLARRCCRSVIALDIEQAMRDDMLEVVTVSIGIGLSEAAASSEQLIEMADRALYRAKRSGRNRPYPDSPETVVALRQRPGIVAPISRAADASPGWRSSGSPGW